MDTKHLKQRHQSWYLNLRVPSDLVDRVGKTDIVRSLGTRDLKEANKKKHGMISEYEKYFESLRNSEDVESPISQMKELAKSYRQKVLVGLATQEEAFDEWCYKVDAYLERYHGLHPADSGSLPSDVLANLEIADSIVKNPDVVLMSEAIEIYLLQKSAKVKNQTLRTMRMRLEAFAKFLKVDKEPRHVKKRDASSFVTQVLLPSDLNITTKKDYVSYLSSFFKRLYALDLVESNPFQTASSLIEASTTGEHDESERREWQPDELLTLFKALKKEGNKQFTSVTLIALYQGMRSNEVCEALHMHVKETHLFIHKGKTKSSLRGVPYHPIIKPLIAKLVQSKTDAYLIPSLKCGGDDNKRNHWFVKDFSEFRLDIDDIPDYLVFHCLRNNFTGALDRLDLQAHVIKQLVGHAQQEVTFKNYSDGRNLEQMLSLISKISYGEDVDNFARQLVADF